MKNILIVSLLIVFATGCSIRRFDIKDAATIKSSFQMVKITNAASDSMLLSLYKNKKIQPKLYPSRSEHFRLDNIQITINGGKTKVEPGYLNTLENNFLNPDNKRKRVEILTREGKQLLIVTNAYEDIGWLFFMCVNKENTGLITGQLNFKLADEQKATAVFDDLIENLKFKE